MRMINCPRKETCRRTPVIPGPETTAERGKAVKV